ncbi:hypothetical protein [Sphingomonas sp. CARO-RG-8B-R24-01]|uniref:hypothetical protein n=1 Tax=Sphingomonas sp. CARO-RG-8B-R24-01 TaxID=2914831 RepID=UPI001F5747E6|nr:hypothetical protein [Sphingomonas sp. CARO-RG-8B-R24-01]
MTIIYVHGVKVRSAESGKELGKSFQHWLAPKLSVNNALPGYEPVYWGDLAATFRWNLASRPPTPLLGMGGAEAFAGLGSLRGAADATIFDQAPPVQLEAGPVLGGPTIAVAQAVPSLETIPFAKRPDFLADLYLACLPTGKKDEPNDPVIDQPRIAGLAAAAAAVAGHWDAIVASEATEDARARSLVAAVDAGLGNNGLVAMGGIADWMSRAGEVVRRAAAWPGDAVGTIAGELRPLGNTFVAYFIGDVLTYLDRRGSHETPGPIPTRLLAALRRAQERKKATGEKIVIVSHSMGGQLIYDALTTFAVGDPLLDGIEIDHWITCGCQVSLFAEMQLFPGQPEVAEGQKLPMPARVRAWTNYYDTNDLVGFVMEPVFDGAKDLEYHTGYGLILAHTGFLARPSFFQAIADRL